MLDMTWWTWWTRWTQRGSPGEVGDMGNTSDGPHVCRHVRPRGGPSHLLRRVASTLRAAYPTHAVHSTHARTQHAGYTNHLWAYATHARAKYPRRYAEPSRRVLPFRRHPRQPRPACSCIVDIRRPPVYCARVGKHRNWLLAGEAASDAPATAARPGQCVCVVMARTDGTGRSA